MRFRFLVAFALALLPGTFVASAHAAEPIPEFRPAPPTADLPPPGARTATIVAGAATTVVSYGLAVGASFLVDEADHRGIKDLRIPIAGPWIALGKTGCPTSDPDCSVFPLVFGALVTILDGVVQAGGLAVVGEGLFLKTSTRRASPQKAAGPTLRAVPLDFDRSGVGLGVIGSF
ncbi:MAG: hypothetical protein EOO73_29200 [Myxococcales bacterium]|nr:MAG: hypothetical protein EOO73_29200 [Myxococcales bacterium]